MGKINNLSKKRVKKEKGKISWEDVAKKGGAVLVGAVSAISCVACNNINSQNNNKIQAGENSTQQNQTPTYNEIPYALQTKSYSYSMDYPADFFSSMADYFSIGGNKYVDLTQHTQVYVFYEKGLEPEVIAEIKNAAEYLENTLHPINSGYRITVQEGEPKKISQYFNNDSIYFRKMTSERYSQMNGDYPTAGITVKTDFKPPQIYINTNVAGKVVVDGKYIDLNRTILHEMLHGFGLNHTEGKDDIMYFSDKSYVQDSQGKWMIDNFTSKEYVTDYFKFSDDEIRSLIYNFSHAKKLEINVETYHIINKVKSSYSKYEFQERCDKYLANNLEKIKNSTVGEKIEGDQIICLKQATKDKRIVLNADYIGMYKIIEKGKVTRTGQYLLMESEQDGVMLQTIVLAKSPVCSENVEYSTFIRPDRKTIGGTQIYFTGYNGQLYIDDTANWLKENNIEDSVRPLYSEASLGTFFDGGSMEM